MTVSKPLKREDKKGRKLEDSGNNCLKEKKLFREDFNRNFL